MKDNKLLAEYLGLHKFEDPMFKGQYYYKDGEGFWCAEFEWTPNYDWNQLMMVVDKIEEGGGIEVEIVCDECSISGGALLDPFCIVYKEPTKIEAVYNACVEYIKSK